MVPRYEVLGPGWGSKFSPTLILVPVVVSGPRTWGGNLKILCRFTLALNLVLVPGTRSRNYLSSRPHWCFSPGTRSRDPVGSNLVIFAGGPVPGTRKSHPFPGEVTTLLWGGSNRFESWVGYYTRGIYNANWYEVPGPRGRGVTSKILSGHPTGFDIGTSLQYQEKLPP